MKQSIIKLSKNEKLFLKSILKDGNKSDAQIARETGMSKATANRIRKDLINKKVILEFMPIVDLDRMGINLFMVILFRWKGYKDENLTQSMFSDLEKDSHVAFLASGEGSGFTHILFLGFSDLAQAHVYLNKFRKKYEDEIENMITFFIPSNEIRKQDYTDLIRSII
jgi:DNA-binding Lrp family transcriptional regulator